MAIPVRTVCSECLTLHKTKIDFGQVNITCPSCGHAMKNLPEEELNELDVAMKKQRTSTIIALIAFGIAATCFFVWVLKQEPTFKKPPEDFMMQTGLPALTVILAIVGLVFGILASRKRFVIEY